MGNRLSYFVHHPGHLSVHPLASDLVANAVLTQHLIGTLVRYNNGGQVRPYIAESYQRSANGHVWTFKIKPALRCSDGELISTAGYRSGLIKMLREYAARGVVPVFSDLIGWDEFINGKDLAGVRALDESRIQFEFSKPVGSELLEYLTMPYYGYLAASNFSGDVWAHDTEIVSSGPYRLTSISGKQATLIVRKDWHLNPPDAPEEVSYNGAIPEDIWSRRSSIVMSTLNWKEAIPKKFVEMRGPPDVVRPVLLDHEGPSGFFKQLANRRKFQKHLYEEIKLHQFRSRFASLTESFYPGIVLDKHADNSDGDVITPTSSLSVFVPADPTEESKYVIDVVERTLQGLNWPYQLIRPETNSRVSLLAITDRKKFDIRIANVFAGSVMEPWVVEMMFCSNLGVSFPDPNGRICRWLKDQEGSEKMEPSQGSQAVSQIIFEDAAVLPVYHGRATWYFSDDIDVSRISGDLMLPSFEDLSIRNSVW